MSILSPAAGVVPADYVCRYCGATGCKLWRLSATFRIELACLSCLRERTTDEDRMAPVDDAGLHNAKMFGPTSQYMSWVPEVPTHENDGYWGLTSIPPEGMYWWRWLPTVPQ